MTPRPAVIGFAGPRDRYQSALALQENHALEALVTEAYFGKFWAETGLAGQNFHRFAKARHHPDIPATKAVRSLGAFVRTLRARLDRRKDSPHLAIADRLLNGEPGKRQPATFPPDQHPDSFALRPAGKMPSSLTG